MFLGTFETKIKNWSVSGFEQIRTSQQTCCLGSFCSQGIMLLYEHSSKKMLLKCMDMESQDWVSKPSETQNNEETRSHKAAMWNPWRKNLQEPSRNQSMKWEYTYHTIANKGRHYWANLTYKKEMLWKSICLPECNGDCIMLSWFGN